MINFLNSINNQDLYEKTILNLTKQAEIITGPFQICIDITNKCMLKCLHCYNQSGSADKDELSDDEFKNAINQIISLKPQQVCFCGGEPLMRKELLYYSIERLADNQILPAFVSNGYLLNESVAKELGRLKKPLTIQISLDGHNSETHDKLRGVKGSFDKAVNALKLLKELDIYTNVAFSPTKFNIEFVEKVAELAKSLGVKEFRVQPLMNLGVASLNVNQLIPSHEQYRKFTRFQKKYLYVNSLNETNYNILKLDNYFTEIENNFFNIAWGDPIDHLIRFGTIFRKPTYTFGIFSNGDINATPYLPIRFGNIKRHTLREYWASGLNKVWENPILQEFASLIRNEYDLGRLSNLANFSEEIFYDLIENNNKIN